MLLHRHFLTEIRIRSSLGDDVFYFVEKIFRTHVSGRCKAKDFWRKKNGEKIWDGMFRPKNNLFSQTDDVGGNIFHCLFIS